MPPKSRRNGSDDDRDGTTPDVTTPDAAPKMHILQAEIRQDRKETEELLAGFERPNRSPPRRPTPRPRDFVDYHLARGTPADERRAPREASAPRAADEITVSRRPRRASPVLAWGAIIASMVVFGGGVTYFVAGSKPVPDRTPAASGHTTSANAAHASASSHDVRTTSSREGEIPPPALEDADTAPAQTTLAATSSPPHAPSASAPPRVPSAPHGERLGAPPGRTNKAAPSAASPYAAPDRATDGTSGSAPAKPASPHTTATPTVDMGPLQRPSTREDFVRDL